MLSNMLSAAQKIVWRICLYVGWRYGDFREKIKIVYTTIPLYLTNIPSQFNSDISLNGLQEAQNIRIFLWEKTTSIVAF